MSFLTGLFLQLGIGLFTILALRFVYRDLYRCWWNPFDWRGAKR